MKVDADTFLAKARAHEIFGNKFLGSPDPEGLDSKKAKALEEKAQRLCKRYQSWLKERKELDAPPMPI